MSLPPGTRLGPYEILSPLGAGGMGEVYRAHDARLDRDVAIKVLPAGSVGNADAEARFEREARAVAALNHPHICALYDVGRHDGRAFLVMELLDGETLYQRLTRGLFDLGAFMDHALALADALDAAHARGILHRDLKPANIVLTSRGQMKILDFGLAKAINTSSDATRVADGIMTGAGTAIGTMGYMSPEQLRGELIDARSDLFSLGVVLYEMATGQRAFTGGTGAAVSAAILTAHPVAPRDLRSDLPEKLEEAILKTLEKDRDVRCQSAAELRADLKRVKRVVDASSPAPIPSQDSAAVTSPAGAPASSDRQVAMGLLTRHPFAIAGALVIAAGLLIGGAWTVWRSASSSKPVADSTKLQIESLTFTGNARDGALSPDGKFVAYVHVDGAESSVRVRQLATQSDVPIVAPAAGRRFVGLSVTPDGSYVDFVVSAPRELWRVPFLGGTPRRLVSNVWSATGWAPDGRHFAFIRANGLTTEDVVIIAEADGANQRVLSTRHAPERFLSDSHTWHPIARPSWSADKKTLLVLGRSASNDATIDTDELVEIDVATGAERRKTLLPGMTSDEAAWADDGHALINARIGTHERQLSLLAFGTGLIVPITQNLAALRGVSLTAGGLAVVSTRLDQRSGIWIGDASGNSIVEVVPETPARPRLARLDGRGGLVYEANTALGAGIYSRAPGAALPVLVVDEGHDALVTLDGRTIVFVGTQHDLRRINVDGSGLTRLAGGNDVWAPALTTDGQTVLFASRKSGAFSLWAAPLVGGPAREIAHRYAGPVALAVSPGGHHLLFNGRNVNAGGVTVLCDLPDCTNQRELPLIKMGVWTPDGLSVAYVGAQDPTNIQVQPVAGGAPRALTHFTEKHIVDFAWSPDGKRLAITRGMTLADMVLIKGFR